MTSRKKGLHFVLIVIIRSTGISILDHSNSDFFESCFVLTRFSSILQLYNIFPGLAKWIKNRQLLLELVAKNFRDMTDLIQQLKETLNPDVCRGFVDCFLLRKQKEAVGMFIKKS